MQCRVLGRRLLKGFGYSRNPFRAGCEPHLKCRALDIGQTRSFTLGRVAKRPLHHFQEEDDDELSISEEGEITDEDLVEAKAAVPPSPATILQNTAYKSIAWEDDRHPIRRHHIPKSAWIVLLKLRAAGHEGFVVGGAVRDLLLGRQPKDFDIVTSASVSQVKKLMHSHGAKSVGRRFPIVVMNIGRSQMEVSSFSTSAQFHSLPPDANALQSTLRKDRGGFGNQEQEGQLWSDARRWNAQTRDFTVNALLYEPFSSVIYDYVGGVADCRQKLLRSIVDAEASFAHDPARMVRAVRHAARADFKIHGKTAAALKKQANLLSQIQPSRLTVEIHSLMAYGSSSRSVQLLWQYNMLNFLFPELAEYLQGAKYPKSKGGSTGKGEPLFTLLAELDRRATPAKPLPASVWQVCLVDFIAAHLPMRLPGSKTPAGPEKWKMNDGGLLVLSDSQKQEYLQRTKAVLASLVERPEPKLIIRASREPLTKLLRQQLHRRLEGNRQVVKVQCRGCKQFADIPITYRSPKCQECGRSLPTTLIRNLNSPELISIVDVLQATIKK